jgi:hypothetical protein
MDFDPIQRKDHIFPLQFASYSRSRHQTARGTPRKYLIVIYE